MSWGIDEDDEEEEQNVEASADGGKDTTDDAGGWGADVQSVEDDTNEEEDTTEDDTEEVVEDEPDEEETFSERFARLVDEGNVEDVTVSTLEEQYKDLEEAEILERALEQDTRSSSAEVYERRLRQVTGDGGEDTSDTSTEETTGDDTSDDDTSDGGDGGWGVDEEDDDDTADIDDVTVDSLDEEVGDDTSDDTEEPDTPDVSVPDDDETESIEEIDVDGVAPGAMTTNEAAKQPYLWRILGWAQPGKGKTHFGFTMPQPVCIIDTEGKAHQLASKFDDKVTYIWQPDDYDEARNALFEAIDVLETYLEKGHRGTIVVDSMSEMWEWSKQKYVSKVYDGKSLDEVNLSSNMGRSGESDWKVIKRYHNKRFRQVMVDTPFHLYWTAMQTDDYEAIMEGDEGNPKKPVGERDNGYKVDQVLRFAEGPDGTPHGQLQKSGSISKYGYSGLQWPTFQKHREACERVRELEEEGQDPLLADFDDVRIVEGNPGRWSSDD